MILTSSHSFLLNTKHGSTPIKLLVQIPKADQAEHLKDIAEVNRLDGIKEGKIEGIDLINVELKPGTVMTTYSQYLVYHFLFKEKCTSSDQADG